MNPKDRRSPVRKMLTSVVELLNKLPGADDIKVETFDIYSEKIPRAFDGYRIVQLSDLHGRWFGSGQQKLIKEVALQKPDIILVTGDWIGADYKNGDKKAVRALIKGLLKICPVKSIIGNHEARAVYRSRMIKELDAMGVDQLLNQSRILKREASEICLIGFVTPYEAPLKVDKSSYKKLEDSYKGVVRLASKNAKDRFIVAMCHRPELIELYEELGLDLVLSGHAHGGLMPLPAGKRLLAPGQGFFPKYTHGLYQSGNTRMIVSSGLGGPRIGIKPEISTINLYTKD